MGENITVHWEIEDNTVKEILLIVKVKQIHENLNKKEVSKINLDAWVVLIKKLI